MGGMLKVRVGTSVDIPVTVTGLPLPTCCLKKEDDLIYSGKCRPDILQLAPVKESDHGLYSVSASNCFSSDTKSIVVDVLSKHWLVISVNVLFYFAVY